MDGEILVILEPICTYKSGKNFTRNFKNLAKNAKINNQKIVIQCQNLEQLDYFFAHFLQKTLNEIPHEFQNLSPKFSKIFEIFNDLKTHKLKEQKENFIIKTANEIGESVINSKNNLLNLATFLGEFFTKLALFRPQNFRAKEISNYAKEGGIEAIFIVSLTAFLIGVVLAYIGSDMLSQFGASVYIIDIMGMLTLREIAPLIAAIVIAGRSASSFTAQIGVMKITEEIDAMKTMGFDPFYFLCMPRILAMIFITPLVIFIADAVSIFAQMLVCNAYLDIFFVDYLDRFKSAIDIRHFFVGLIKAPFFGAIIAIIGCLRGFEVKNDTQSIGEYTTISVVNAIFWVIAIDALFAVIFSELKI